jgi:dolichol-phosphate mannosyltransferase
LKYNVSTLRPLTKKYALVIPVINEGLRLHRLLGKVSALNLGGLVDVIVTDGGSTDNSTNKVRLKELGVNVLIEKQFPGKLGAQLQCAYDFLLRSDYLGIVTIDGNDKDEPDAVTQMIELLSQGYDFVQASRFVRGGHHENTPLARLLAIRLLHAPILSLASGFYWTDTTQGFRAYSSSLLKNENLDIFRSDFYDYKLLFYISREAPRLGLKCVEIPSTRNYPEGEVPTKIRGFIGNLSVLVDLLKVALGKYSNR